METMKADLFEEVRERCGGLYISDIRFEPFLTEAKAVMREIPLEQYSVSALNDMAEYL